MTSPTPFNTTSRQAFLLRVWFDVERGCWFFLVKAVESNQQWLFADYTAFVRFFAARIQGEKHAP